MHSIVNPDRGVFEVLDHDVSDYSVLVFDHTLMLHKALCACDDDKKTLENLFTDCLNYLYVAYGKYGLKRTSVVVLTIDSMKFPLKITAHANRKKNKFSDRIHTVLNDKVKMTERLMQSLHAGFGCSVVTIEGITQNVPRYIYRSLPQNNKIGLYLSNQIGTEVEADLIQVFCALDVASAFPQESVAIVAFDSDVPIILSAVHCYRRGSTPSNCHVVFGWIKLNNNMAAQATKLKINVSHLDQSYRPFPLAVHPINRLLDVSDIECLPNHYSKAVSILFKQLDENQNGDFERFAQAFERVGLKGAAFLYCLDKYMSSAGYYLEVFLEASVKGILPDDFVQDVSHNDGCKLFMTIYRNGLAPFGIHQKYLKALSRLYVAMRPSLDLPRVALGVVAAVVGGCDYSIPLHNCGTKQLLNIVVNTSTTHNYVAEPNLFTENTLNSIFVAPSVSLLGNNADFYILWRTMTTIVRHVIKGWVTPGYFMDLYTQVLRGNHDCYVSSETKMDFALTNDKLALLKKRIKRPYGVDNKKNCKRLRLEPSICFESQ